MLRLLLPPNLASAASRDAIAVKIELALDTPPTAELLPGLAMLQALCRTPTPPPFAQLSRAQLKQLVESLQGRPVFFWLNQPAQPILWIGPVLRGVSEHLQPTTPASAIEAARTGTRVIAKAPVEAPPRKPRYVDNDASRSSRLLVDGSEHFLAVALPSREHIAYNAILDLLKTNGFALDPSTRKWWLRDRHKTLNFLARHQRTLADDFHADFTPNFEKNTARLQLAEIACDAVENGDGFNVTLALRAGRVSEDQILSAAAANRGYVEDNGGIYLLDPEKLQELAKAQRALAGDLGGGLTTRRTHRVSSARLAEAETILEEIAPHFQPPAAWRARSEALRHLDKLAPAPLPADLDQLLRPYQRIGAAWLWHLYRHQLGGILADEMGLGKTLQALALFSAINATTAPEAKTESIEASASRDAFRANIRRRDSGATAAPTLSNSRLTLVVCPASLVENWRREAARFAPKLRVFVHHGNARINTTADAQQYQLIITSYGTLARDRQTFEDLDLGCLIADEAQHLKNRRSQNAQALRALRARGRFLLTGTPVENSLDDLRSLFEVLMPGYIEPIPAGTRGDERNWFDERLRAKTAPYILRRTKLAVAPELPAKIEQVLYCELSPRQAALYRDVQEQSERALLDLEASGASENSIRLATLTQLLRLRQVCCDPRLLPNQRGASAKSDDEGNDINLQSKPANAIDSAKLDAFRELLSESVDDGHRLLVFSQFTSLLGLLREELEEQEISYCYLDGSMTPKARQVEVDRYNNTADIPVFLISLKAGGTGLNLTAADTVVHFDPWWNPAVEAQATDRAHRIGQTRVVTSYKLICSGTVEEKVLQLQSTKRELLKDVFEASDAATAKINLADLKALLAT